MITLLYPCLTHVFRLTEGKPMTQAALLSIQGLDQHLPPRHWGCLVSLSYIFCLTLIGQPCMPYSFKGPVSLSSCSAHMKNSILQCYHTGACGHTQEWPSTCLGGSELGGGGSVFPRFDSASHYSISSVYTSLVIPALTSSLEAKQISSREGAHPSWEHNQTLRMILLKPYSLNFREENQVSILLIIPAAGEGKEVGFPHEHWVLSMFLVLLWLQMVNEECHPIHPVIACLTRWAPGVWCWERGPLSIQPKQID